jgi:hypothetical protein
MIPNKPTSLQGKSLEEFKEYQDSIAPEEELDWLKEAIKHYESHRPKINIR